MLFRRRHKRSMGATARELVWPSAGWRRTLIYLRHRIQRMPGTPYAIAGGLAWGAAVSFTPFMGLHFVLAALLAWMTRTSIIASALGTVVGNPWTFPFIWAAVYQLGSWILGSPGSLDGNANEIELTADLIFGLFGDIFAFKFDALETLWHQILAPMTLGGFILGAVAWGITFVLFYILVNDYQRLRRRRIQARADRIRAGVATDQELDQD